MKSLLAAGIALMTTALAPAQDLTPGAAQARTFKATRDGSSEPYNLYIPKVHDTETSIPLVIALHGKGATWESWFAATTVEEWGEKEGYAIATPHGRGDWFYQGPGEQDVLDVIADVKRAAKIDPDRVYLIGHSMGGFGTWHLAASHPDLFAAVVPMATWPPEALLPNLRNLEPLVIHGGADDIVPPLYGHRAHQALTLLNIPHEYVEVEGADHGSKMINDMFPRIGDYLRGRRRVQHPDTVTIRAFTPRRGKAFWLALHRTERFPRLASLHAAAGSEGICIRTENVAGFALMIPPQVRDGVELKLLIDNQEVYVPGLDRQRAIVLTKMEKRGWQARMADPALFNPPAAEDVFNLERVQPEWPAMLAEVAARRVGADALIVPRDLLAPTLTDGLINEDQILDLFLRPEDELVRYELTPEQYRRIVEQKDWYPAWWGQLIVAPKADPAADQHLVVVAPAVLATRIPEQGQRLGITLREIWYDHAVRSKSLLPARQ